MALRRFGVARREGLDPPRAVVATRPPSSAMGKSSGRPTVRWTPAWGAEHRGLGQMPRKRPQPGVAQGQVASAHLAQVPVVSTRCQQLRKRKLVHHRASGIGKAFV